MTKRLEKWILKRYPQTAEQHAKCYTDWLWYWDSPLAMLRICNDIKSGVVK